MRDEQLAELVGLACHDLRTPLATISGFSKTLVRAGELPEREARFVGMIDEAAEQIQALVDELSLAARLAAGTYTPVLTSEDTLELTSSSAGERVRVEGAGPRSRPTGRSSRGPSPRLPARRSASGRSMRSSGTWTAASWR